MCDNNVYSNVNVALPIRVTLGYSCYTYFIIIVIFVICNITFIYLFRIHFPNGPPCFSADDCRLLHNTCHISLLQYCV